MSELVEVTDKALDKLRDLGVSGEQFLRLSVVSGGCSGMTYQAAIDAVSTPFDKLMYENDGVRIVTDEQSFQFLEGLEIDYSDDLIKSGFKFSNKNAVKSCGCGSSFGV